MRNILNMKGMIVRAIRPFVCGHANGRPSVEEENGHLAGSTTSARKSVDNTERDTGQRQGKRLLYRSTTMAAKAPLVIMVSFACDVRYS